MSVRRRRAQRNSSSAGRFGSCLAIAVVAILAAACADPPADRDLGDLHDPGELAGRLVPNQAVVAVPDRFWEADADTGTWSFRGWANLVIYVDESAPDGPLSLRLVPDEASMAMHFSAQYDGQGLGAAGAIEDGAMAIDLPVEMLSPGLHLVTIRRSKSKEPPEVRELEDCRFEAIEYTSAGVVHQLKVKRKHRYELIRAFLEDGVTGASRQRLGGLLVMGNQVLESRLTVPEDGEISFQVAAIASPETRFSVEVDGVDHSVQTDAKTTELRFPIGKGAHELRLVARGVDQGLYLWGTPFLHTTPSAGAGPVILVTLDTTRKDALSVYGGPPAASPNIDRLASRATVFDDAWSTSPWTLPSHVSLFTGLYPTRHGAGVSKTRFDGRIPTVAGLARAAGFRTAGFSGGALSASRWGVAWGFEFFRDPEKFETTGDLQTDHVKEFLERHGDDPFFLFVNYFDPHAMYRAPDAYEETFDVETLRDRLAGVPIWEDIAGGNAQEWRAVVNGEVKPTPAALEYLEAAYLAEVAFMDHQIGRLVSMLEERGLFDRATVILVADHGEFLGEGGFFSHACRLDPELTEIPLIIKWPGQSAPERDDRLVSQVDLYGTVLASLGVQSPPRDGLPLATTERSVFDRRSTVFMEEHENRIHPLFEFMAIAPHIYGLQQRNLRQTVWNGGAMCSERDRGGWVDAACDVSWEQRFEELAAVAALPVESDLSAADAGLTDDMREHLEALGYIR